jgi:glycosyltransferase involved in cell wall biosynthesis
VHLVHNERQLRRYNVDPDRTPLVMFNSISLAGAVGWPGRSIVVRPPVFAEDYRVEQTGTAITLVNLMQSKGAGTFFELARAMPDREFLAVVGAYGLQVTPGDVPNVTFLPTQTDAREIYRRTRVLLMPSEYESWGRVGIEAAASGIPTIAHPTPGLLESLAGAGTFVDREDLDGWVDAIEGLDLPYRYAWMSLQARRRSEELDPTEDLDRLEEALVRVVEEHRAGRMGERDPVPAAPGADLVGSVPSDPR